MSAIETLILVTVIALVVGVVWWCGSEAPYIREESAAPERGLDGPGRY